ncbi:MFS transporter [Lichenifustis flavocetrariae]|uniref:MFS transporter n=1 Tax=Lichenifustis flavocetrariae TaxID=2949735 RepID=A0AA41Z484_9HYPH|nr:MFS transporter [Lichenifustis flavocetrariae]MCW6510193.1 MFS transporter [Lichenifustis flavocetrariae]
MTSATISRTASWNERGATSAIFLVLGMGFGAWAASLPGIKADLSLTDRDISFALLTLSLTSTAATLMAGSVAPRLGTGRATAWAALAFCITAALPAWAGSLPQLVGLVALFGLANGFLDVSMNSHATDVEQRWGRAIMSSFHGAFSLGGLIGSAAGGLLLGAGLGPAGEVSALALATLVITLIAIPALGAGSKSAAHETGLAWPIRAVWGLCAVAFCGLMVEGAMADWSAIYLSTVVRASEALSASGYAAFSVTMTIGRFAGDSLVRRFGASVIVIGGSCLAAIGLALSVAMPTLPSATVGFLLVGLGLSNIVPAVFSAAGRFGRTPAAGIAAVVSCGYVGFISGPPIIGAIATVTTLRIALGCVVLVAGGAVLSGIWSRHVLQGKTG